MGLLIRDGLTVSGARDSSGPYNICSLVWEASIVDRKLSFLPDARNDRMDEVARPFGLNAA